MLHLHAQEGLSHKFEMNGFEVQIQQIRFVFPKNENYSYGVIWWGDKTQ